MRNFIVKHLLVLIVLAAAASRAFSGEALVSTMQNVSAYFEYYGYSIRPIGTTITPGDDGPTQLFEILRPSNCGISLGRLYTSCTCIRVTTDKKSFGSGESAVLTVRNVRPTSGNTYPFYVQVTSPTRVMLRYDTYVISDRYIVSNPTVASANEVHIYSQSPADTDEEIETIVPKHESAEEQNRFTNVEAANNENDQFSEDIAE